MSVLFLFSVIILLARAFLPLPHHPQALSTMFCSKIIYRCSPDSNFQLFRWGMALLVYAMVGSLIFCLLGIFRSFIRSLLSFIIRDAFCQFSLIPGTLVSTISFICKTTIMNLFANTIIVGNFTTPLITKRQKLIKEATDLIQTVEQMDLIDTNLSSH